MGKSPEKLPVSQLVRGKGNISIPEYTRKEEKQVLVGTDVFVNWKGSDPEEIGTMLSNLNTYNMKLKMITNRGVKVFPDGLPETYCTDHWRCRFVASDAVTTPGKLVYKPVSYEHVIALLSTLHNADVEVIKTENLYEFDGRRGFSLGQGE